MDTSSEKSKKFSNKEFEDTSSEKSKKFSNKEFEDTVLQKNIEMKQIMQDRLDKLNQQKIEHEPYNKTVGETIINTKDALYGILDDLLQYKFTLNTFTKENRLYYIGIVLLFIVISMYIYDMFVISHIKQPIETNVITVKLIN